MWIKMVFVAYMSITVTDQENNGTHNYLIETTDRNPKAISISTKNPIPYKTGEKFIARFHGKCQEAWSISDSWETKKNYICTANYLETHKGVIKDILKK